MRFKYYLRGCGMGILVATLLLMVAAGTKKQDMRDEDVIARAKELGMVFLEEGENPKGGSPETKIHRRQVHRPKSLGRIIHRRQTLRQKILRLRIRRQRIPGKKVRFVFR